MVKITKNLLKRCSSKNFQTIGGNEVDRNGFIKQVTHLYLQEKNIKIIENLDGFIKLLSLYLYDNEIREIENLDHLTRLTTLYLHGNEIEKIENLSSLHNLKCLKLGRNKISVVENLEQLTELEQLWLENQDLPMGMSLTFKPRSILAISKSLKVLNVSGNNLKNLLDLRHLRFLDQLYAENNKLDSLQELVDCVVHWTHMTVMKLRGNDVCRVRKFKDNVVVYCPRLKVLDEFTIPEMYRTALLKWKEITTRSAPDVEIKSNQFATPFLEAQEIKSPLHRPHSVNSAPELSKTEHEVSQTKSNETI